MNTLIELNQLYKKYKGGFELGEVNLKLNAGDTVAFLGQNGAGKSTLFQMLTGNMDATKGQVLISGKRLIPDNFELKRKIGYLPQNLHLPKWVTCKDILLYGANLYSLENHKSKIAEAIKYWDCNDYQNKPLASCSHGMQKRVGLALATIHNPDCLILDEPFSGLDIFHTRALENEIERRQKEGKTTIISTHVTPYVAKLCQQVFIVEEGKVEQIPNWLTLNDQEKISVIEDHFFKN